ncbi:DsbA family protein [Cryobacterium fucosi]|uniref:Disulfide bond formation protein n=1 Tax=Cryobacterium fucosi TaxID=1259157 RepID=A0A4R9B460_9MICO|nr:thioredoxin domain-containing protein [Cryobacterium fucosi]TFD75611.1 disulfide bond formation protein [Cryobacterium fucosi]
MASTQRKATSGRPRRRGLVYFIVGGIAIVAVLGVGLAAQSGTAQPDAAQVAGGTGAGPALPDLARRIAGDPTALGEVTAPVVLVEYADFRCPFCGVYARETLPPLVAEYVKSGRLRMEWRDFPVFGQESTDAAVAARAAGEQGRFWEFNAVMYAHAPERAHLEVTREILLQFARDAGVPDLTRFESELSSPALLERVTADTEEAYSIGATGTPLFLVNGTPISGAQPLEVFRQAIDNELAKAAK